MKRVKLRVLHGGHHVPDENVSRRFERSTRHFLQDYLLLADEWTVWDKNSPPSVKFAERGQRQEKRQERFPKARFSLEFHLDCAGCAGLRASHDVA